MAKVFVDGGAGTTGLRICERLRGRADVECITLPEALRKDLPARLDALAAADVAFLCLPDAAAKELVTAADAAGCTTTIIDTSTAHRTADGWTYGFAELAGQREKIAAATRIANPGCHATGFIATVAPLVAAGLIAPDAPLSAFSLTGYSGGGKGMIAQYEAAQTAAEVPAETAAETPAEAAAQTAAQTAAEAAPNAPAALLTAPRVYGLSQAHKHLPEMVKLCGITAPPAFSPIVANYYAGMLTCVSVFGLDPHAATEALSAYYADATLVRVLPGMDEDGFLSSVALSGRDSLELAVFGNAERATLCARFDNLGKGASGAAIQNMNIVLGVDETLGLVL